MEINDLRAPAEDFLAGQWGLLATVQNLQQRVLHRRLQSVSRFIAIRCPDV